MFSGYFSYDESTTKIKPLSNGEWFDFSSGFVFFSNNNSQLKDTPVHFLIKYRNKSFYTELYDKLDSHEYNFESNLALINSTEIQKKLNLGNGIFIIVDEQSGDISLIRDLFGTVPLFYSRTKKRFLFSSDINCLLNHELLKGKQEIDSKKVINYLTWLNDGQAYTDSTFYKNINSVLPGHLLTVTRESIISNPIISFQPRKWDHISSIEEYGYAFQEIFKKSIANCIGNETIIASHLSGGMDSSSVSSMIRQVRSFATLHTLYADTKTSLTDEMFYVNKVSEKIKSINSIVSPSQNELDLLISNTTLYNFPEHMAISPSLQTSLIRTTKTLGSKILLTGTDGDSIVGHGYDYTEDLFNLKLWDELKTALSNWALTRSGISTRKNWTKLSNEEKKKTVFRDYFYQKITKSLYSGEALSLLEIARSKFSVSYFDLFNKGITGLKNRIQYLNRFPDSILSKSLASEKITVTGSSLPDTLRGNLSEKYSFAFKDVFYNQAIVTNEESYYLGRANGISIKYPFYNKDLYELCMAIPSAVKYNNGNGRGHFREAMKGILVDEVRTRTDKGIFSSYGREAALRLYSQSRDLLTENNKVWHYVDRSLFLKCITLLQSESQEHYIYNRTLFFVNRTIFLSVWLNTSFTKNSIIE